MHLHITFLLYKCIFIFCIMNDEQAMWRNAIGIERKGKRSANIKKKKKLWSRKFVYIGSYCIHRFQTSYCGNISLIAWFEIILKSYSKPHMGFSSFCCLTEYYTSDLRTWKKPEKIIWKETQRSEQWLNQTISLLCRAASNYRILSSGG